MQVNHNRSGVVRVSGLAVFLLCGAFYGMFRNGEAPLIFDGWTSNLWWLHPIFVVVACGAIYEILRRRKSTHQKSLQILKSKSYPDFRLLVAEALRREGYTVIERSGLDAEYGADMILKIGQRKIVASCLHWESEEIDSFQVQELCEAMVPLKADAALFVTTGKFTAEAKRLAKNKPVILANAEALLELVNPLQTDKNYESTSYLRKASLQSGY